VRELAPSDSPEDISGAVHDVKGSDTEKSALAPAELETIASLDPVESLTTVAVTPRRTPVGETYELMVAARSVSVSPAVPLAVPVWKVAEAPVAVVSVKDPVASAAVGPDSRLEYQEPWAARLLTTTVWLPRVVPSAAVAVTSLLEDVTVRADSGPVSVFSASISVVIAAVAV
jgi:hypothetical protein